ncbi:MAG: hypothetical protein WC565_00090 [Parcubacteria group bacterium]
MKYFNSCGVTGRSFEFQFAAPIPPGIWNDRKISFWEAVRFILKNQQAGCSSENLLRQGAKELIAEVSAAIGSPVEFCSCIGSWLDRDRGVDALLYSSTFGRVVFLDFTVSKAKSQNYAVEEDESWIRTIVVSDQGEEDRLFSKGIVRVIAAAINPAIVPESGRRVAERLGYAMSA